MDIFSAIISSASDTALLLGQIIILSIVTGIRPLRSRAAVVTIFIVITSFLTELFFYQYLPIIQYILVVVNSFKGCLFTLFVFKAFSMRNGMLLMIMQFTCSIINSGIYAIIPSKIKLSVIYLYPILLLIIRSVFLLISYAIKKSLKNTTINNAISIIPTHIYLLILAGIFIENGLVEGLGYSTSKNEIKIQAAQILLLLLVVCISILIVSLTVNVVYKGHYITINKILEKQIKIQLDHYEKREQLNTEIRRFRHDYENHMNCLKGMLESKKYDEAKDYLTKLSEKLPSVNFIFNTGNYIADAILTDKQEASAKRDIVIKFDGCITEKINNTDLCIILSNALDNAIESSDKFEGEKLISVYGNFQQGYFVLIIKNPSANIIMDNTSLPTTSKNDKIYHGFGLFNIRQVVNKYNGTMKISSEENAFILSLTFNNISSDS